MQPLAVGSVPIGTPVGFESVTPGNNFVVLKPFGGVASLSVFVNPAANYKPTSTCQAKRAVALRFNFGAPSKFLLTLGSHPISTCSKFPNVSLDRLSKGPGKP
jgi:hypothetical protein